MLDYVVAGTNVDEFKGPDVCWEEVNSEPEGSELGLSTTYPLGLVFTRYFSFKKQKKMHSDTGREHTILDPRMAAIEIFVPRLLNPTGKNYSRKNSGTQTGLLVTSVTCKPKLV